MRILDPVINPTNFSKDEVLILQFHRDFGNIPFLKLKEIAIAGIISKRLAKCSILTCSACIYNMMEKGEPRTKVIANIKTILNSLLAR